MSKTERRCELIRMKTEIKNIIDAVAEEYGVSEAEIMGRCRERKIADARMMAIFLISRLCGLTMVAIGSVFGRNHATVYHALHRTEELISFYRPMRRHYERLNEVLKPVSHAS